MRNFFLFLFLLSASFQFANAQTPNPLNLKKIVSDPMRSRAYAVHQDPSGGAGALIVINQLTEAVVDSVTVGIEPSDLVITDEGDEILVINTTSKSINRIDLDTLNIEATYNLSEFSNRNDDFGGHVEDGPGNIIYYVDEQWGPRVRVFDSDNGTVLQTFGATVSGTNNDFGFGDIVVNGDQTKLYGWAQYGDGAGSTTSYVVEYNISVTGTLTYVGSNEEVIPRPFTRAPFDTPALMSDDGHLFIKRHRINPADLTENLWSVPTEVYAISPLGELAVTDSRIYQSGEGRALHDLATSSTVKAITGDYTKLIQFNDSTQLLEFTDLIETVGAEVLGLDIAPDVNSVTEAPSALRWNPVSGASGYQVYLGTDESSVNSATSTDPEYRGLSATVDFNVSSFSFVDGETYYWRIVPIIDGAPVGGTTRSFTAWALSLSKSAIDLDLIEGVRSHGEQIDLSSVSATSWTASTSTPWISLNTASGSSPDDFIFTVDSDGMSAGAHAGSVTLQANGSSLVLPVSLNLIAPNYTLAKADPEHPYIYAISQTSESSFDPAFLVKINTDSGVMEDSFAVGDSVSDLAVHHLENRIYLTNWKTGLLLAYNRDTLIEEQAYTFSPAGAVGYSSDDVYRIAEGAAGRLIVEEQDQWIDVRIMDTSDGTFLATTSERAGGGVTSPVGDFYFHGDSNSSGAELHRFTLGGDTFTETHTVRVTGESYYGSRTVVNSGDGSRVYWNGGVFESSDLSALHVFDEEVLEATRGGEAVFTETAIYNGVNFAKLADLPSSSLIQAVEKRQQKLYTFDGSQFSVFDFSSLVSVSDNLIPDISDGETTILKDFQLGWTLEPFAVSYDVYFGTSQAAVDSATTTSSEFLGNQAGNSYSGVLPSLAFGGEYFWRVDVRTFGGVEAGDTWSFQVAPFDLSESSVTITTPEGVDPSQKLVQITSSSSTPWTAVSNASWLTLSASSGTTDSELGLDVDATGLAVGSHSAEVTIASGAISYVLPVSLEVIGLNFTLAVADLDQPYIYAISQTSESSSDPAFLIKINSETDAIEQAVFVGSSVTDLAIHYAENRIYLTNWQLGKLIALDRGTLEEVQSYAFATPGANDGDVYRIAPGAAGRLIVEEEDQWIEIRVMNTADGTFPASTFSEREGGGVSSPQGDFYFHGDNNSSGAEIHRFALAGDSFTETHSVQVVGYSGYGSRTIARSGDGSRVYWNGGVFDSADLSTLHLFDEEVLTSTNGGEAIFTENAMYGGGNYSKLADIPVSSAIQAVNRGQNKLFTFNGSSFSVFDFSSIIEVPSELTPSIEDGSATVLTELELSWNASPFAVSYDVYFGASRAALDSATTASAEFLGNQSGTVFNGSMPSLSLGAEYFWRVDVRAFDGIKTGSTWSFQVAPFDLSERAVTLSTPVGIDPAQKLVQITSSNSTSWTAVSNVSWLTLSASSGTTDSDLGLNVDASALAVGNHSAEVTITSEGSSYVLPVSLEVIALNFTLAKADLGQPYIYAISQTSESSTDPAFLIKINSDTDAVEQAVFVGSSVTDLVIHYLENRIYLTNWRLGQLIALDRNTLEEVQTYAFTPAGPVGYSSGDVYRISAGAPGRLIVEEQDQWIDVKIMDTSDGTFLATTYERAGGGVSSSQGDFYFHGDSNSSGAEIHRFALAGDSFAETHAVRVSGHSYYGSRTVIGSGGGTRVYWNGGVFDSADLSLLHLFSGEVLSVTNGGEVIFTETAMYGGGDYSKLTDIPASSEVQAVDKGQSKLFTFDGPNYSVFDFSSIIEVPSELTPLIEDGSTTILTDLELSWTSDPFAVSYDIYFGTSQAAVDSATTASGEFLGNQSGTSFNGSLPSLNLGSDYFWRVDVRAFDGVETGSTWSFEVAPFELSESSVALLAPEGVDPAQKIVQITSSSATPWTAVSNASWLTLSASSGTTDSDLGLDVDTEGLAVGDHSAEVTITSGGSSYVLPVSLKVIALNFTLAKADLNDSYIYAISQTSETSTDPAFLIKINSETEAVEQAVFVGGSVTDFAIHYSENRIYVTNWKLGRLIALDRDTLEEVQTYAFSPAGATGYSSDDVYRISAGAAGRLIVEEEDQWVDVRIMDTSDGTFLATTNEREGGGVSSPQGDFYFHGDNNSSGAEIHRLALAGDSFAETHAVRVSGYSYYGSRTVVRSGDGSRVYWNGGVFDSVDLSLLHLFDAEVLSATTRGEAIFTSSAMYGGGDYSKLIDLPVSSAIQAVDKGQGKLFTFDGPAYSIFDFSSLIEVPSALSPLIEDDSITILTDLELGWSSSPLAISYDVYFGTSQAAVDAATTASGEFLGNQSGTIFNGSLPSLVLGGEYFWRVDVRAFDTVEKGVAWSFEVAPFDLSERSITLATPDGVDPAQKIVQITSSSASPWTAVSNSPWLTLSAGSGTTDFDLGLDVDGTGLAVGDHSAEVTITSGESSYILPVSLEVIALNYTLAKADLEQPYIYAISQPSETSSDPAFLIKINSDTDAIEQAVSVGSSVTDLAIHYAENRIYVTNWKLGVLIALDRDTLEEVQTYAFSPAGPTGYSSGDVYRISAGRAGRLIVEEEDQWIDVRIMDTSDGTFLATTNEREGGGVSSPQGDFYFHGDNNSSGAEIHRLALAGDSFTETHAVRVDSHSYYGSRRVVRSNDGAQVCWNGGVFDSSNLATIQLLNAEVISLVDQWHERIYLTSGQVFDGDGNNVGVLPFATEIQAVPYAGNKVFLFLGGTFTVYFPPVINRGHPYSSEVDSDGDGFSDMVEGGMGTDPQEASSCPEINISIGGDHSSVSFDRFPSSGPYSYPIEYSEDLKNWTELSSPVEMSPGSQTGLSRFEFEIETGSNPCGFYRVKVSVTE